MMKTACILVSLSLLATLCTSLSAEDKRTLMQYWKGRFSRDFIPDQGRFSRDKIAQYWKGRFSRNEIPALEENDKRELAGPMKRGELQSDIYGPMYDQYWKGRFMRLRGGHKRQFLRGMVDKYGMRDMIPAERELEEALPIDEQEGQEEEKKDTTVPEFHSLENQEEHENVEQAEEKRQEEERKRQEEGEEEEEEERNIKDDHMQGRFARQGRFKKNEEENMDESDSASEALEQGRFRREAN